MSMKESASFKSLINNRGGTYCIGIGTLHDAIQMDYEMSKPLVCMHDPMAILIIKEEEDGK